MTEQLYSESRRKILLNKKTLEKALDIRITTNAEFLVLEGKAEDELIALKVIEAIDLGFSITDALMLRNEDFIFEKIKIKSIEKRNDMRQVRGRVIGKEGKVLRIIQEMTNCSVAVHDNSVGIIGHYKDVRNASYVLKRIVAGSKHASMYAWLEKKKAEEKLELNHI